MLHIFGGVDLGRTQQTLGGQVNVLKIFKVFEDRLTGVEGFGATCFFGQGIEALLSLGIKSDGKHGMILTMLSASGNMRIFAI